MESAEPAFLLSRPELVTAGAPWCVRLGNLELGILVLAHPWLAGGGVRRAELERRLAALGRDLPLGPVGLGPVYFQRVNRAVTRLEAIGALGRPEGAGSRRFAVTPPGFAALVLNLRVLEADPTVDGGEFELKRALVGLWSLVVRRVTELPEALEVGAEADRFFAEVEALEVLGRRVITDELVARALDVLSLVAEQRRRVEELEASAEARLRRLATGAELVTALDLGSLSPAAGPAGNELAALIHALATGAAPRLALEAALLRYRGYLGYLDGLAELYARGLAGEPERPGLDALRRLAGGREA